MIWFSHLKQAIDVFSHIQTDGVEIVAKDCDVKFTAKSPTCAATFWGAMMVQQEDCIVANVPLQELLDVRTLKADAVTFERDYGKIVVCPIPVGPTPTLNTLQGGFEHEPDRGDYGRVLGEFTLRGPIHLAPHKHVHDGGIVIQLTPNAAAIRSSGFVVSATPSVGAKTIAVGSYRVSAELLALASFDDVKCTIHERVLVADATLVHASCRLVLPHQSAESVMIEPTSFVRRAVLSIDGARELERVNEDVVLILHAYSVMVRYDGDIIKIGAIVDGGQAYRHYTVPGKHLYHALLACDGAGVAQVHDEAITLYGSNGSIHRLPIRRVVDNGCCW